MKILISILLIIQIVMYILLLKSLHKLASDGKKKNEEFRKDIKERRTCVVGKLDAIIKQTR